MSAHARLSPSSADRFMVCPGSVRLIERLAAQGRVDPGRSSGAADEGTAAHQVRGDALMIGLDAYDFEGSSLVICGVEYPCDDDMANYLQPGIDWIREQPGELIVEHRVDLGRWMPGQFGTLDTAIIDRSARRLVVNDLKYGSGVPVAAEQNRQLRIYAIGVMDNFDLWGAIDEILIVIDQPRAGGMKFWSITATDLEAFAHEVKAAALLVDDPDAPLNPDEKACKFCPVRDDPVEGCPAYNSWMMDLFDGAFDDVPEDGSAPEMPDPDRITPERRYYIVRHSQLATQWLAKLHEMSLAAAEAGRPDPGSKVVAGQRGARFYRDADRAEEILVGALGPDDAYTRKIIGIPDAEKNLKPSKRKPGDPDAWAALSALIDQREGKPILVSADDPRPAIPSVDDIFSET